jgi:fatty acid desaturase
MTSAASPGRVSWYTPNYLDADQLRELSEVKEAATIGMILVDLAAIVMAAALSEAFRHPVVYFFAVILIGGRLHNLGALGVHEGAHYRLARNKRINDFIANYLLTPLVFFDMPGYRKSHLIHHQFVGQDGDTEKGIELLNKPSRAAAMVLAIGLAIAPSGLSGIAFILALIRQRPIRGGLMLIMTGGIIAGAVQGVVPCILLVKYWLIPFTTWLGCLVYVRGVLEHLRVPSDHELFNNNRVFLTRTVRPSLFDRIFVIPIGLNYHLEHHLYPSVPCYRLGRLHALLMRNEDYRRQAIISRGYFRTIGQLIWTVWRGPLVAS